MSSIEGARDPDAQSKVKLIRQDLGDLRLKQLESEAVVDDYKRLMATGKVVACNRGFRSPTDVELGTRPAVRPRRFRSVATLCRWIPTSRLLER